MYIQKEPICAYFHDDRGRFVDSCLFFHTDYPSLTFNEFCLYVVIPAVEDLKSAGYTVQWGYVNSSYNYDRDVDGYKKFLEEEIRYEKQEDSAAD